MVGKDWRVVLWFSVPKHDVLVELETVEQVQWESPCFLVRMKYFTIIVMNIFRRYGYYDQHGKLNIVNYTADPYKGFHAEGEHVPQPQYRR